MLGKEIIKAQVEKLNLYMEAGEKQLGLDEKHHIIRMPKMLHLLTTYFSFKLIDLPQDYQSLVKSYYLRQCRGC